MWSFNKIKEALIAIEKDIENNNYRTYYIGGSLCIDFNYYPNVLLNRNGRGFFYGFKSGPYKNKIKDIPFVVPNDMKELVLKIYNKHIELNRRNKF